MEVDLFVYKVFVCVFFASSFGSMQHGHGFGSRGSFIQQGCIGQFHGSKFNDYRLEIDQRLQPSLGDFCLIGGIGSVPAGVLQDIALYDSGYNGVVVSQANKGAEDFIFLSQFVKALQKIRFRLRLWQFHGFIQLNGLGDSLIDKLIQGGGADVLQHMGRIRWGWAYVSVVKFK